ncbi:MAG: inner-rane translocator [Frankiales bacterium]|nr:inner-rane translocator [Frankiales bacterium]
MTATTVAKAAPAWHGVGRELARWLGALGGAVAVFSLFLLVKGHNPFSVLADAVTTTFTHGLSLQQVAIKAAPFVLSALAVVVPARPGLVNVGGEGQIIVGAVAAGGVGMGVGESLPGIATVLLMALAAAAAGAVWAGIAAVLRLTVKVNEAVSTLLLNYIAIDLLLYLIYQPWKDMHGSGQPASRPLADVAWLPVIPGTAVHFGVIMALLAAVAVWWVMRYTAWGFTLRVVGGNAKAAVRAGLPVPRLLLSAMLVGGALAGLAGMVHFAGVEYKLKAGMTSNFGYVGFLASWLAMHRPLAVTGAAVLMAAITVAGDSLQIDSGLPAATVNVFTGLALFAVLGWAHRRSTT